ncbi:trimethylamine methyltransferase family protein [Mesorhizobium sp.]|uniref:trimethylamine methyltransferase family protein n=1 Tax=Mesorhizobium sp. TaxID=1871066 RepID=UPI000FE39A5A|nr:trimethylamine methyltransferase family protein [Mesorhizobium sp.]RWH73699.1 MAG: methyltransferase [Mesorhizobium sp.]RWL31174.1 MAG: methyltransferase [Mesorhizobium sp.]RWL36764.1 MAG: methyltransferase [Mesorhizobium sp.]RWL40476.1 MAG: methyltransferase [Mesorhizobium sp.]RWL55398.1 MAG: methyltransferase [Mesorhizobium sp.]
MSEPRRKRGAERTSNRGPAAIPQLPLRRVENPYPPMAMLSADQIEAIHHASMHILENFGIEVMSPRALSLFERAGARVDHGSMNVRIDRGMVEEALTSTRSSYALIPRNPARAIHLGGSTINFTLVAGPPNVHDMERGRRAGNMPDYQDLVRLAQHFNCIHMLGNQVCAPIELPANTRHMDTYFANLTLTDKCFHVSAIGRGRALDGIEMMAIARGLTLDEMARDPGVTTIISVNSPRRFDEMMAEGLMTMAECGQSVAVTPFTLMGAMSPVTLAGALAQQNAEALFGIMLTQLVRPGAPVMYGAFTSNVDMKSGAPAFGTPENTKANIASGQLARRYNLPYRTTPGSASNAADAQGAYETMMALWGAVLGHGNLIYHAAGWQEGGLTASFEKLIIDVEMIQHMMEFLRPIVVDEAELAVEALGAVPTGGHFFGEPHTLERYATAFYQPMLSNWQNYEAWQEAGALDTTARATRLWKKALEEYVQPAMDPAVREALEAYMARRKEAIGQGEP